MNRTEIKKFYQTQLAGLTPDKQVAELDKLQECLKQVRENTKAKIDKKYIFCFNCRKYYPIKSYKIEEKTEKTTICTYRDCGYGDDDMFAPAIRKFKERICPKCGARKEVSSDITWVGKEHRRGERY